MPLFVSTLALLATAAAAPQRSLAQGPAPLPITVLSQGSFSGYSMSPADVVVLRPAAFARLWKQHAGTTPPVVDFSQESVLAVFGGNKPTGGFSVSVVNASTDGVQIHVSVEDLGPGRSCNVIQVNTTPFVIVKVPKITLPVIFQHTATQASC